MNIYKCYLTYVIKLSCQVNKHINKSQYKVKIMLLFTDIKKRHIKNIQFIYLIVSLISLKIY